MAVPLKNYVVTFAEQRTFEVQARDERSAELAVQQRAVIWDQTGNRVAIVSEVRARGPGHPKRGELALNGLASNASPWTRIARA